MWVHQSKQADSFENTVTWSTLGQYTVNNGHIPSSWPDHDTLTVSCTGPGTNKLARPVTTHIPRTAQLASSEGSVTSSIQDQETSSPFLLHKFRNFQIQQYGTEIKGLKSIGWNQLGWNQGAELNGAEINAAETDGDETDGAETNRT